MRETIVVLDSETALNTGVSTAIASKYYLTKARISSKLHHMIAMVNHHNTVREDPILLQFRNNYDPMMRKGILHTERCGTFFGVDVFLDDRLKNLTLALESEPIPADKL
jgi:hypothetical protein